MRRRWAFPLLVYFCHHFYIYFKQKTQLSSPSSFILVYLLTYETIFWTFSIFFEFLDRTWKDHPNKIKSKTIMKHSFVTMFPQVLLNHILQGSIWFFCATQTEMKEDFRINLFETFFWFLMIYIVFDAIFYAGHYAMHHVKFMKPFHMIHHETFSTSGISGHYMSVVNFFFDSIAPGIVIILLMFPLGCTPMGFISFAAYGIFNTVVVHSGWNFKYMPDPLPHFYHHTKYNVNYSAGIFDKIFKTELKSE
jgi:sterol desaturase/sphingolipid hydroxylase (fatty acid hydroxylase superfamily)